MRKLTVKNFSVIKDAELEFGKITVLIGPQASGKSLLCKLAYFLGGEIIDIAVESLINRDAWSDFIQAVAREFHSRFSTSEWLQPSTIASFTSRHYSATVRGDGTLLTPKIELVFSNDFQSLYEAIYTNPAKQPSGAGAARAELRQDLWVELTLLLNPKRTQANLYIPSGRTFFTDAGRSVATLQNPDLDRITRLFAGLIAWDSRWKSGFLTSGRSELQAIETEMDRIAGGLVTVVDGKPLFVSSDGRSLPLAMQSSGTLELLPMFNVLKYFAFFQEHMNVRARAINISPLADVSNHSPLVYMEEPEAHIFPYTQYELVKLFAWLTNDPILSFEWFITTHSPYVLTAFNNLLEAGQIAGTKPELKNDVAKVIPEHSWISQGDFKAYALENGALKSIVAADTGLVSANYLDQVSETIGGEFDELLRLGYAES